MSSISQNNSNEVALLDCVQKFFIKQSRWQVVEAMQRHQKRKAFPLFSLLKYKMGNIFTGMKYVYATETGSFKKRFQEHLLSFSEFYENQLAPFYITSCC